MGIAGQRNASARKQVHAAAGLRSGGILLLDMALALTVMLLLFAVVWPTLGGGTTNLQESATALDIATLLRFERTLAGQTGKPSHTRLDLDSRTLISADRRQVAIPNDLDFRVTTGAACMTSARRFVIVFAPDGTSCGGVIVLKKGGTAYAVRFN